jgi:uncharacterized protein YjiS (DUF1127 family)
MHTKTWIETGRNASTRSALAVARSLLRGLGSGFARARQRRQLGHLSDHQLRDIGLSRAEVEFESHKAFWRL